MVRLTKLGQRFLLTTNPFATSVAFESVFKYLVVGVGDPSLDFEKYALALPVGQASAVCEHSSACGENGHSFRVSDGILYCDVNIVRTWKNYLPLPVAIREFGFSPSEVGAPLSAVGYPGDSEPSTYIVPPGEAITLRLSIALAVGPMTLTPTVIYSGGNVEYTIYYGLFAESPSLYPELLKMVTGSVAVRRAIGTPVTGYQPTYVDLMALYRDSVANYVYSYPHQYLTGSSSVSGTMPSTIDSTYAIVYSPSGRESSLSGGVYRYRAGVYFVLPPSSSPISPGEVPTMNVSVQ